MYTYISLQMISLSFANSAAHSLRVYVYTSETKTNNPLSFKQTRKTFRLASPLKVIIVDDTAGRHI